MTTTALSEVLHRMRTHKVNHGKNTSPTLIAFADEIESALASAEPVAWYAPSIDDTCTAAKKAQRERDLPETARLFTVPLYTHAPLAAKVEAPGFCWDTVARVVDALTRLGVATPESPSEQAAHVESMVLTLCHEAKNRPFLPTPASVPGGLTVDVFYLGPDDDAFVCEIQGKATIEVIAEIEAEIRGNPLEEFEKYGAGTYRLSASYFSGQYGEFDRCELAPCYELGFISHTPIPADEEPTNQEGAAP